MLGKGPLELAEFDDDVLGLCDLVAGAAAGGLFGTTGEKFLTGPFSSSGCFMFGCLGGSGGGSPDPRCRIECRTLWMDRLTWLRILL